MVSQMTQNLEKLKEWIGQKETDVDYVTVPAVHRLAATLDLDYPTPKMGDALPVGWYHVFFPRIVRHSQVGPDGHPARGDFLPPVPLPRRMFAGRRVRFLNDLRVGDEMDASLRSRASLSSKGAPGRWCSSPYRPTSRARARSPSQRSRTSCTAKRPGLARRRLPHSRRRQRQPGRMS